MQIPVSIKAVAQLADQLRTRAKTIQPLTRAELIAQLTSAGKEARELIELSLTTPHSDFLCNFQLTIANAAEKDGRALDADSENDYGKILSLTILESFASACELVAICLAAPPSTKDETKTPETHEGFANEYSFRRISEGVSNTWGTRKTNVSPGDYLKIFELDNHGSRSGKFVCRKVVDVRPNPKPSNLTILHLEPITR